MSPDDVKAWIFILVFLGVLGLLLGALALMSLDP